MTAGPHTHGQADASPSARLIGYRVDDLTIDVRRRLVSRDGQALQISGLSYDLLLALVQGAPSLLTFDELLERVWPALVVNPETVIQRVKLVRDALNDEPNAPRYIAGVRGRGYRLLASVTPLHESAAQSPPVPSATVQAPLLAPVAAEAKTAWSRWHRWRMISWITVGVVAAVGSALLVRQYTASNDKATAAKTVTVSREQSVTVAPDRTLAVLPFANLSDDAETEYFSDGLTDELRNRLIGIPALQVAARTSSSHFKGRTETAQNIGHQLGVRHLLEGSVRKSGDALRITAQLTNADTGFVLWSHTFDGEVSNVFAIQDQIALAIVDNLQVTLLDAQRATPSHAALASPQAFDLYLRARHLHQSFLLERMDKAIEYYQQAIKLDPQLTAAYVGLADTLVIKRQIAEASPNEWARTSERITAVLRRVLEIDPKSGDAHAILGQELELAFDLDGAEREFRLAEGAAPNNEYVLRYVAQFYACCSWPAEKAIDYARKGHRLDPLNPWAGTQVGIAFWHAHRYEDALRYMDDVIEVDPQFWIAHWLRTAILDDLGRFDEALLSAQRAVALNDYGDTRTDLAIAYARLGRRADAVKIVEQLTDSTRAKYWRPTERASVLVVMKDHDGALSALEQAYDDRDFMLVEAMHRKVFVPLHEDARFQRLVRLLGQERRADEVVRLARSPTTGP